MRVLIVSLIIIFLIIPVATVFIFSPPSSLLTFFIGSIVTFFIGKSRRVYDPISGIPQYKKLSLIDFHKWADFVTSKGGYEKKYNEYVFDKNRGYDLKLPLLFSQIMTANYIYAHKILLILLIPLNAFCFYNLYNSNLIFKSPVGVGLIVGILWGYSIGLFILWRQCRKYKGESELPI